MDTPWAALAAGITRLSDRIDALPTMREALATSSTTIRFDTDTTDTTIFGSLVSVVAGDRVLTVKLRHYVWVLGVRDGGAPAGTVWSFMGFTAPAGWALMQGQSLDRGTYARLFNALNVVRGTGTVTIASPGVFTLAAHGFTNGQKIWLTTTGALPTGLSANTTYYVVNAATNTFQLSASQGGAAINTSGSQSGVHTVWQSAGGVSSSTTFIVPDGRGRTMVGRDGSDETFNSLGETGGAKTHTLGYTEVPVQKGVRMVWGQGNIGFNPAPNAYTGAPPGNSLGTFQNDARYDADAAGNMSGGGQPHNNLQPFLVGQLIIKL